MNKKDSTQKALNLWAIVLIVWSLYRANLHLPEWFDEFFAKPIVFIFPVICYIRKIEKRSFFEGVSWRLKSPLKDYLIGLGIGGIFLLTMIVAMLIKGRTISFHQSSGFFIAIALATAISEEILSRGFVLKRLYQESKNALTSSLYASFLFFFLHVPVLLTTNSLSGYTILFIMMTDLVFSMVSSLLFLERKNLLPSILIHAFYNITIYLFV